MKMIEEVKVILNKKESETLDYAINKILVDLCCIYDNYCCKGCPLKTLCDLQDMSLPRALNECISTMEVE